MRLSDKLLVFAKKKKNNADLNDEYQKSSIKDESSSVYTEERNYPSLGENYSNPGVIKILRFALSVGLLVISAVIELSITVRISIQIAAALIIGYDIVIFTIKDIQKRMFLRENLFVAVAAILSFCIGRGVEAIIALMLLQIAYIVRDYALFRTRKSICETIEPQPVAFKDQTYEKHSNITVYSIGDIVNIDADMSVPTDCVIVDGSGMVDLSFITGDSSPILLSNGDYLPAGSVCIEGQFIAKVNEISENALYKKTSDMIKAGYGKMTETERKWEEETKLLIPFSLFVSVALLIVLPFVYDMGFTESLRRVITIIAIASPCGILFTIPIAYLSGMAAARKLGIVFRDARAVEKSALIKSVVFNKVGTLTEKNYFVSEIKTDKMDSVTFLKVAAYAESNSNSPVAWAIVSAFGGEITKELVQDFIEYPGKGVSVTVDGIQIILGSGDFIIENGVSIPDGVNEGNTVHMSVNGVYAGRIVLSETIAPDTANSIKKIYTVGVERIAMVSGDGRERDRGVSAELGINEYYAECSPEEKILRIESMKDSIDSRNTLAFVGGFDCSKQLFDAADVGISINVISCRSDLPQSDAMVMSNSIKPISSIISASKDTNRLILWGVLSCCLTKLIIIALAVFGIAPLWFGLLIDMCASLIVVINCAGPVLIFHKKVFQLEMNPKS